MSRNAPHVCGCVIKLECGVRTRGRVSVITSVITGVEIVLHGQGKEDRAGFVIYRVRCVCLPILIISGGTAHCQGHGISAQPAGRPIATPHKFGAADRAGPLSAASQSRRPRPQGVHGPFWARPATRVTRLVSCQEDSAYPHSVEWCCAGCVLYCTLDHLRKDPRSPFICMYDCNRRHCV
jgi:hypothetical protein